MKRGDSVSFEDRKGRKHIGVLVDFVGSRWAVQTTDGLTWRCPEKFLKLEKAIKGADRIMAAGDSHLAERKEKKEEYKAKKAGNMADRIKFLGLAPGQRVKVYNSMGWTETQIVAINKETGKVAVISPKYRLFQTFRPLMHNVWDADRIARMEKARQVITVWADRIKVL